MERINSDWLYAEVYNVVAQIPRGKVLSYGDIARLCGCPMHSRMVGCAMRDAPSSLNLPCHRVVAHDGRPATGWAEQIELLRAESAVITSSGKVDMKSSRWEIMSTLP